jgi:hypothetical protein
VRVDREGGEADHVQRNLFGVPHHLRAEDFCKSSAAFHRKVVAIRIDDLLATKPVAKFER